MSAEFDPIPKMLGYLIQGFPIWGSAAGIALLLSGSAGSKILGGILLFVAAVLVMKTQHSNRQEEHYHDRADLSNRPGLGQSNSPNIATKKQPFRNSLGMRFVPIPGTNILACIWLTRVRDHQHFTKEAKSNISPNTGKSLNHPAVNVSWDDANRFCDWLSKKEDLCYRLPSDHEWSLMAEVGEREDPSASPMSKCRKIKQHYPWVGHQWPPPLRAGSFVDLRHANESTVVDVGIHRPNSLGIYDLAGNVMEWCRDPYEPDPTTEEDKKLYRQALSSIQTGAPLGSVEGQKLYSKLAEEGRIPPKKGRVCRGSFVYHPANLLSSYRERHSKPSPTIGFRCILELD